ncbi:MAG: hypothetical protein ACM3PF_11870 [Bacteroidota bacterium]
MELLEQYLRVVRANLPKDQRDDIVRELSDNLRSQMEDKEAEIGHPLTRADQEAILKAHGHPMIVASRYRGERGTLSFGRQWIGPELFPIYAKVLTINGIVTAVVLAAAVALSVSRHGLGSVLSAVLWNVVVQFTLVTAIFVGAQMRLTKHPDQWDPATGAPFPARAEAPRARGLDALAIHVVGKAYPRVPRLLSVFELTIGIVGFLWWLAVRHVVRSIFSPEAIGFLRMGPAWNAFYTPFLVLVAASLIPSLVNLVRPGWARFREIAHAAFGGMFLVLFSLSLRAADWIVLADPLHAGADQRAVAASLNAWIGRVWVLVIVIVALTVLLGVRRVIRGGVSPVDPRKAGSP